MYMSVTTPLSHFLVYNNPPNALNTTNYHAKHPSTRNMFIKDINRSMSVQKFQEARIGFQSIMGMKVDIYEDPARRLVTFSWRRIACPTRICPPSKPSSISAACVRCTQYMPTPSKQFSIWTRSSKGRLLLFNLTTNLTKSVHAIFCTAPICATLANQRPRIKKNYARLGSIPRPFVNLQPHHLIIPPFQHHPFLAFILCILPTQCKQTASKHV